MDRCVVLVDAGYLLGAAASLLAGEPARSRITVDHSLLIQGLRERAERDTGCRLLRIYWFDGAPDRVPQPEHRRLRVMPRVTVRLGALTRSEGRWAQKGVDAAMHAELTELARNRACADIVLVTGDGDLLPGLMSAKEHGVAVHLWAVQAADGDYNQSEDLVAEADERRVLDREWITRAVRARDLTGICPPQQPEIAAILSAPLPEPAPSGGNATAAPGATGVSAEGGTGTADAAGTGGRTAPAPAPAQRQAPGGSGVEAPLPGESGEEAAREPADGLGEGLAGGGEQSADTGHGRGVPTPKDLAGLGRPAVQPHNTSPAPAGATLRWSSDRGWADRSAAPESPEAATLPMLAQLTTAEQRWADREEDITTVSGDPFEVGQVFARRWIERLATFAHLRTLSGEYPRIPHRIDGELLRYAARFGLLAHKDDQIDEHDRYAIRAGFWREVDARTTSERAPAAE
ncbi:NYN domain-containing protein [Streptomyces sp. CNQ085]|uniref:NYN domain-containing protein n=1 Tax=Streptomyces sp. CNQ085 TaxID=2886944 RepID=UPI001F5056B8|nr:NYN domain-containing protein [Streptomyces sp. CNQ085]MCI0385503.1 NYN domain-containing protein [Streptomyces sp. CNQ085]